jgi:hypothetical protein
MASLSGAGVSAASAIENGNHVRGLSGSLTEHRPPRVGRLSENSVFV